MMMTKEVMLKIINDPEKIKALIETLGKITDIGNIEGFELRDNHFIEFEFENREEK